ncbi:DUF805 domain-containing protein [Staphylococcus gallinarum]|uniref:DUF805 domain-containing protein n=1 Tax=Staphylococcus gallinarum TaxID=1293 RepID=UPI001E3A4612|nr:DUF805 domain-containing protein [Staphylococcus gallinarum]MCD8909600.1 DUF805 domain-containing protein [Staphylococcus gallinarum]
MDNSQNQVISCYKAYWTRFLDVNGCSTRPEFWHPFWINFVISALLGIVSGGLLSSIFAIAIIIPTFTVMARRLHDTNRTMLLAVVFEISGLITTIAAVVFIVAVVAAASSGSGSVIGASLMAGAFGTAVAGIITIYTLVVLIAPGNKGPNNYGDGGSCEVPTEVQTN